MNKNFLKMGFRSILMITTLLFSACVLQVSAEEYYFSSSQGDNSFIGTSENYAKRDFTGVSFSDGDTIYLKSGDVWNEGLYLSGLDGISIATYGGETCAVIDGKGNVDLAGIVLTNCSNIQISSVCVKNTGAGIVFDYNSSSAFSGISVNGCEFYSVQGRSKFDPASQTEAKGNNRRSAGIEIIGEGTGIISDITIADCKAYMGDALLLVNVNDAENTISHSVENLNVKDCHVSGSLTHGIHISGVKNGKLSDCTITDGRPMDYPHGITGIFLAATENFTVDGCEVSYIRNYHDNPDGSGIDIEGNNLNTTISNCNIHHCDGIAISAYYANVGCEISSNTFYMNDLDGMEKSCILTGDAKKPSADILIKDNKWYQMKTEGYRFIKNLNPEGDYNIIEEKNTQIELIDGVVYSQNFDYFPLGARRNGLRAEKPELGKAEISGNQIERNLFVEAFEEGYSVGRALPEMTTLTAKFRIKPLSGRIKFVMGEAELAFYNSVLAFGNTEYKLSDGWNEIGIALDCQSRKYELIVNSDIYAGECSAYSSVNSIQFIAQEKESKFLLDDFAVLKGFHKAEFEKSTIVNNDRFNDFVYNGRITNVSAGDRQEQALVINKVIKSGTTVAQRDMNFNNTSFCADFNSRFIDKAEKEIMINNGTKTYLTLRAKSGELTAVSGAQERVLCSISEAETYKVKICYDSENIRWIIRINDSIYILNCKEKVISDKICFRILEGGTGEMQISCLSAYKIGNIEFLQLDETFGDIREARVRLMPGENFNGGAYIEEESLRMYREKTVANTGISGEMKIPMADNMKGNVRLSFDVLLENYRMTNHIIVYGHNAEGGEVWATAMRFAFDSYGRVQYVRNNKETGEREYANASALGSTSATRYDYNRFINVAFEINTDKKTVDIYVDGVAVVRNVALLNDICDISGLGFRFSSNQTQAIRVKNFCFEEFSEGFIEKFENMDNLLTVNDGGTVKCDMISYGEAETVLYEKYSACQKVLRTYEITKNGYEALSISGGFVFGKAKGRITAIGILDNMGESILEIYAENNELYIDGKRLKSISNAEETDLLLVIYNDNNYYLFLDGFELLNGKLGTQPAYYRSGIDFNNSGSFEIRNFENVYYFQNSVRVTSNYVNNVNSDTLYSYKNVHFLGNDERNNVNVEFIR